MKYLSLLILFSSSVYAYTPQRGCSLWSIDELKMVGKQGYQFKYDIVIVDDPNLPSSRRVVYSDLELDQNGYIEAAVYANPILDRFGKLIRWDYEGYFLHEVYDENYLVDRKKKITKLEFEACRDELIKHKTK